MSRLRSLGSALVATLALGALCVPSCGGSGDQTAKFVGAWTFSSGTLTPTCLGMSLPDFDLSGLNVTFQKIDDSTISLSLNAGCVVKFHVSGGNATVESGQTCTLDLGPPLGMPSISITAWTLSLVDDHIDCKTISGAASLCTAMGTATLVRGTTDGGTRDAAAREVGSETHGGGSDAPAGTDASDGGAPEAGTTEGGGEGGGSEVGASEAGASETGVVVDGGTDVAAVEAGPEAGADAPGLE